MRSGRRLLGYLILGLAVGLVLVGAFWMGVVVGEVRGGTPAARGESPSVSPWPFPPLPLYGFLGSREHRGKHGALGVVEAVEEQVLVVTGRWGTQVRVVITEETVFRKGPEEITLADVQPGDRVAVLGRPRAAGEIEAKVVWVFPPPPAGWRSFHSAYTVRGPPARRAFLVAVDSLRTMHSEESRA